METSVPLQNETFVLEQIGLADNRISNDRSEGLNKTTSLFLIGREENLRILINLRLSYCYLALFLKPESVAAQ